MGNPYNASQADESLFVDFIAAHQIPVLAKIHQEPARFPKRFGCAVVATGERTALMFSWFDDRQVQNIERPLRMPVIEGSVDPNQEDTFQGVITFSVFTMQTRDSAFHGATSCGLA
jgi:hypothetical protein